MTTIIYSTETHRDDGITDTDAVLSSLTHDANWLIELSNNEPESFVGREAELYSVMNALQLVTSRFTRTAPRRVEVINVR